ncbi:AraC family transcriptional regulator [Echinicola sp. 20G]
MDLNEKGVYVSYHIAEITFQIGFSSPSYFSKCFKREFDLSLSMVNEKLA